MKGEEEDVEGKERTVGEEMGASVDVWARTMVGMLERADMGDGWVLGVLSERGVPFA